MDVLKTLSKEMLLDTEKTVNKIWSIGGETGGIMEHFYGKLGGI